MGQSSTGTPGHSPAGVVRGFSRGRCALGPLRTCRQLHLVIRVILLPCGANVLAISMGEARSRLCDRSIRRSTAWPHATCTPTVCSRRRYCAFFVGGRVTVAPLRLALEAVGDAVF